MTELERRALLCALAGKHDWGVHPMRERDGLWHVRCLTCGEGCKQMSHSLNVINIYVCMMRRTHDMRPPLKRCRRCGER